MPGVHEKVMHTQTNLQLQVCMIMYVEGNTGGAL